MTITDPLKQSEVMYISMGVLKSKMAVKMQNDHLPSQDRDRAISMFPGLTRTMVILAAILDLRTPVEIYMTLDCFNGPTMVKYLCIDSNIFYSRCIFK